MEFEAKSKNGRSDMETVLKSCFWCGQTYQMYHSHCPSCAARVEDTPPVTEVETNGTSD